MTAIDDTDGEDFDLEAYADRFAADLDSGLIGVPAPAGQSCWFTLAATDDPAVMDPGSFAPGGPLEQMEPGAVLAAMAETVAGDPAALEGLSDSALLGVVGRSRALAGRVAAIQQRAIAEYARRVREPDKRKAGKAGYALFAQDDLAPELMVNSNQAQDRMTQAENAERRLPKCSQALWDGLIEAYPMKIITDYTMCLTDEGAAEADEILANAAPGLIPGQLRAMAARVVMMIDPDAAARRREEAAKRARVEKFQEVGGTAALSGRDLPTQAVLRSWQHIDSRARALRAAGAAGTLEQLRVAVYLALTSGSDPLALLPEVTEDPSQWVSPETATGADADQWPWNDPDESEKDDGDEGGTRREPEGPDEPRSPRGGAEKTGLGGQDAPFRAVINLLVPLGTAFSWSSAPGEIPGYGPVDPETSQDLIQAASAHPETRWCVTVIDPVTKEAVGHGCAPGRHRWNPNMYRTGGGDRDGPAQPPDQVPGPGESEPEQAAARFLASLRVKLAPIAKGECDHARYTDKYEVPRNLKHIIKARRATCVAPCCNRPAANGDADHTVPWPLGPTCEENLGAPCRYHHRNKQAVGWKLTQPEPGVFRWTGPSGKTRITRPARYLI